MKQAPILTPFTSQSISQLWRHFYRLPLCSPSFPHLLNSTFSKHYPSSHHPDDGEPWVGTMWRWADGNRETRDSSALALNSPAPELWFFASFVEAALLQVHFLFPLTIPLQEAARCHGVGEGCVQVREPSPVVSVEMQLSVTAPPYKRMTFGKPFNLSELLFPILWDRNKTPILPSLIDGCENKVR